MNQDSALEAGLVEVLNVDSRKFWKMIRLVNIGITGDGAIIVFISIPMSDSSCRLFVYVKIKAFHFVLC